MNREDFISKSIKTKTFNAKEAVEVTGRYFKNDQCFSLRNIYTLNCDSEDILRLIVECMLYQFEANKLSDIALQSILRYFSAILDSMPEEDKASLHAFIQAMQNDVIYFNPRSTGCRSAKNHLYAYYDMMQSNGDIFKREIWTFEELQIAKDRMNQSTRRSVIDYRAIKNEKNKLLIKRYMYHLIFETNNSVATFMSKFQTLRTLLNLIDVQYCNWEKDDAIKAFEIYLHKTSRKTLSTGYQFMRSFTNFLISENIIDDSPIKTLVDLGRIGSFKYKSTAPEDYVVQQIFSNLNRFDPEVALWFLILKCTGGRGSDVCQTPRKCLELKQDKDGNPIYSLRTYSSKMKKDVVNVIPENLYILIDKYTSEHKSTNYYLFPSKRINSCVQRGSIVKRFKDTVRELNITNIDGTTYEFRPHSFRHLMAVKMKENDIPLQFIQEHLHHNSPEMTMAYMEYTQKQLLKDANKFYDINGELCPIDVDIELTDDEQYAEYLNKYINARTLPNGICSKSAKLGPCNHGNACLDCQSFRTSPAFLPELRDQLYRAEVFLAKAIENDWKPQIKTNEADVSKLKDLIRKIEYTDNIVDVVCENKISKQPTVKEDPLDKHRRTRA